LHKLEAPRRSTVYRIDYSAGELSQCVQVKCVKNDQGDSAIRNNLLMGQVLIASEQNLEALGFTQAQQLAILLARPAHVVDAPDIMTDQAVPQLVRQILVEEYLQG
jgi:hypothetical protein